MFCLNSFFLFSLLVEMFAFWCNYAIFSRSYFLENYWFFPQLQTEILQVRRYSPLLESSFVPGNSATVSDEWQAVPDIWRSSAERYGDRIALVDPYHNPASKMTYKEVNFLYLSLVYVSIFFFLMENIILEYLVLLTYQLVEFEIVIWLKFRTCSTFSTLAQRI